MNRDKVKLLQSKIERAFDRLESIADRQKNAIQKLRIALIKNKGNN